MTGRDWHALAAQHGPQKAAYQGQSPAPDLPPTRCDRCGKALKVPAIVVTRAATLCPDCGAAEWRRQAEAGAPGDPPLYGGRRIEDLLIEAHALFDRLTWLSYGGGHLADDAWVYGVWSSVTRRRPRTTWGQVRRARLAAYRRYWRRKRIWLTQ